MERIVVTPEVSHAPMSWSKDEAPENIMYIVIDAPAEVLVEGRGVLEYPAHIRDLADRPTTNVLVERRGALEHLVHIGDLLDKPAAYVLIER